MSFVYNYHNNYGQRIYLQIDNQKVTESLTSSQQELTQYQVYSEQLNTQLATVNQELEETAQQRDEGIQTGREMSQCLTDLQNRVDGLEAQSEQLEQDKFRTQGALDTLQNEHDEVSNHVQCYYTVVILISVVQ